MNAVIVDSLILIGFSFLLLLPVVVLLAPLASFLVIVMHPHPRIRRWVSAAFLFLAFLPVPAWASIFHLSLDVPPTSWSPFSITILLYMLSFFVFIPLFQGYLRTLDYRFFPTIINFRIPIFTSWTLALRERPIMFILFTTIGCGRLLLEWALGYYLAPAFRGNTHILWFWWGEAFDLEQWQTLELTSLFFIVITGLLVWVVSVPLSRLVMKHH